jgi:hypothetical protein
MIMKILSKKQQAYFEQSVFLIRHEGTARGSFDKLRRNSMQYNKSHFE